MVPIKFIKHKNSRLGDSTIKITLVPYETTI